MTTVYQIGTSTFLTKDMVFGWVLIHNDQELDVVSTMSAKQLQALIDTIPNTPIYEEVRKYVFTQMALKQHEELELKAQQLLRDNLQQLLTQQQQELAAKQKEADRQRIEAAKRLQDLMDDWFEKTDCMKVYDVKDDSGHVYAQVVPGLDSYTLIKPNGSVVAVESKTAHIVTAIFKRWW